MGSTKEFVKKFGIYINGIIDVLFIISIFVAIKYPIAYIAGLVIAGVAIFVNVKLIKE